MGNVVDTTHEDHTGCLSAYEYEKRRADFLEARLKAVGADLSDLGLKMDYLFGNTSYPFLGHKTVGGSVRELRSKIR